MIKFLTQLLFVVLIAWATYLLMSLILGIVPPPKKLKTAAKKKGPDLDVLLRPIYAFIGRFMYMEPNREAAQVETLQRAGIPLTPREVMGRSILGAAFGVLITIWGTVTNNKIFMLSGVVLAVALYGRSSDEANQRLKEKDAEVKRELPKFVSTIVVALKSEKNIVKIVEAYIKDAKPALRSDLEVLLSQMSTGNIETALRNFDSRMGAQEVSSLVTSLIYIENGVDQTAALQYLEKDMRQAMATQRRLELEKLPGKMRSTFLPCGIVLIIIFFYAVALQIFNNFTLFL